MLERLDKVWTLCRVQPKTIEKPFLRAAEKLAGTVAWVLFDYFSHLVAIGGRVLS